uniref:Ran-specific GTPase-activating protein n=1 Tax=Ciona savignyi TaxID=51511 RepID=H2YFK5_CIOSA
MRAKLFRWAKESDPQEWKERGTGDVKILQHNETSRIRLLMRRDKTYKICANHYLTTSMNLLSHCGSERAWVWMTQADFADEEAKEELFAIRFLNAENANKFKDKFCECQEMIKTTGKASSSDESDEDGEEENVENEEKSEDLAEKLDELTVKDNKEEKETSKPEETEKVLDKAPKETRSVEDSPEK